MQDKTTMGVTAESDEVEAMLHNLCGFHLAERDPVDRYTALTREQVLYDALVAAIKRERGRALAELVERGHRLTEVAELTGLGTRQRVQRLIQTGAAAHQEEVAQAVADVQEASRQFDERLAAVEATLDEVVSGIPVVNEAPVPNVVTEMVDDYEYVMAKEPYVVEHFATDRFADDRFATQVLATQPRPTESRSTEDPADESGADESSFDPLTGDLDQLHTMLEPTQVMPALSAVLHPTKQLSADEEPWWRNTA